MCCSNLYECKTTFDLVASDFEDVLPKVFIFKIWWTISVCWGCKPNWRLAEIIDINNFEDWVICSKKWRSQNNIAAQREWARKYWHTLHHSSLIDLWNASSSVLNTFESARHAWWKSLPFFVPCWFLLPTLGLSTAGPNSRYNAESKQGQKWFKVWPKPPVVGEDTTCMIPGRVKRIQQT